MGGELDALRAENDFDHYFNATVRLSGELDALRAENEQLKADYEALVPDFHAAEEDIDRLTTENERLKAKREWCDNEMHVAEIERLALADRQWADHVKRLSVENERLRAELALAEHMLKNHIHLADNSSAAQAAPSPAADP